MFVKYLDEIIQTKKEFERICSELVKDVEIRFAGYLDSSGRVLAGGYKDSLVPRLSEEQHRSVCQELASRVEKRKKFDDELGHVKYSASRRKHVVIISFPIFEDVLMVVVEPNVNIDRMAFRISAILGESYENSQNESIKQPTSNGKK